MTNYRYTFKADSGELWRVSIFDLDYSGSDYATLYPDSSGFVISWEGASEETYQPIISSTVTLTLHKDTNSVALLNAIITGTDSQFVVMVSKKIGDGWFLMWKGSPLRDSLSIPDAADGVGYIEIRAIDGFGLLKDIEYEYNTPFANMPLPAYFDSAFRNLLDYDNFTTEAWNEINDYATNEDPTYIPSIFTSASVWYEDSQNSSVVTDANLGDPISNTSVMETAFVTVDDYGVVKGMDLYTVLTEILNAFNLQVSQWNGTYLIIQQNTYSQTSTRFWDYDYPNTQVTTRLADLTNTIDRFTSGLFNHILPVKQVITEYDYKQGIYANNLFPNNVDADTIYTLGSSEIDAAQQYSGRIELLFTSDTASNGEFVAIYLLTIKCGSYYLKSNGSGTYWENTAGKITIRDYQSVFGTVVGTTSSIASFSFSGAPFPTDGDTVNFEWEFSHFENFIVPGTPIVIPGTNTYTYDDIEGSFIARIDTGVPMEGTQLFKATVSNGAKADLELQKSIIGDGANTYSAGALTVTNGANSYNSNVWSIYSDIGVLTMPLHSLRCKEMLALRRSTVQVFECPFNGEIDFHKAFVFESKNWLWLSAEFNCSQNRFSGTAMAIVLDRTNITVADVLTKVEQSSNIIGSGVSAGTSPVAPSYWKRTNTELEPINKGDTVKVTNSGDDTATLDGAKITLYEDSGRTSGVIEELSAGLLQINSDDGTALGDYANGDYTHIESDGTLVQYGKATTFDDIRTSGLATKLGGSSDPTLATFTGNLRIFTFSGTSMNEVFFTVQLPHSYKEGSDIYPHIHWCPMTSPAVSYNVVWKLEYEWQNILGTYSSATTISVTAATGTVGFKSNINSLPTITGTGKTISSILVCRLYRLPTDGSDTYTDAAGLLEFDFHFEKDTLGSNTEYGK